MSLIWWSIDIQILQVPLSIIIEKRGGHKIAGISQFIGLLSTALVPLVAHHGWGWVALLRLISGAAHSAIIATGVHMIDVWIPISEKSMAVTTFQFIGCAGIVFNPLLSGYFTAINWTYAFYGPSLIALIWVIIWFIIVADEPEKCLLVSQQELQLILNNNDYCQQLKQKPDAGETEKDIKFPWKKVFKTPCIYAFLFIWVVHCSTSLGFTFILPRFLISNGIGVDDIAENGLINFYIQLGSLLSYIWGYLVLSYLMKKNVSKINARRTVYTLCKLKSAELCTFIIVCLLIIMANNYQSCLFLSWLRTSYHYIGHWLDIAHLYPRQPRLDVSIESCRSTNSRGYSFRLGYGQFQRGRHIDKCVRNHKYYWKLCQFSSGRYPGTTFGYLRKLHYIHMMNFYLDIKSILIVTIVN